MRMSKRIWMTGCMALVLVAAGRWPVRDSDDQEDADQRGQRTRITLTSKYDLAETLRHVERSVRSAGLPVVARAVPKVPGADPVASDAARVLVLGDDAGRTPIMQADGAPAPELPWQVLIHQRPDGQTEVLLPAPEALASLSDEVTPGTREKVFALTDTLKSVIT